MAFFIMRTNFKKKISFTEKKPVQKKKIYSFLFFVVYDHENRFDRVGKKSLLFPYERILYSGSFDYLPPPPFLP